MEIKMIKKTAALILAILMLIAVTACNNNGNDTGTESSSDEEVSTGSSESKETTAVTPEVKPESISIAGNDISLYTIIYSENENKAEYAKYPDVITQDTEFDYATAVRLRDYIADTVGVTLDIALDTATEKGSYEINIGKTNRGLSERTLVGVTGVSGYAIREYNGVLSICGNSNGATYHAVDGFEKRVSDSCAAGNAKINFSSESNIKGDAGLKVIACIGDSITYGSTSTDPALLSYPAALGRMLWQDYYVYNFGRGRKTMSDSLDEAYSKTEQYTDCMSKAETFDIALVMLGTNDANTNKNGGSCSSKEFKDEYIASYGRLVTNLRDKNSDVNIILMNAPIAYADWIESGLRDYIRRYQKLATQKYETGFFDMYTYSSEQMGIEAYQTDNLHPNDKGYTKMAQGVCELILSLEG